MIMPSIVRKERILFAKMLEKARWTDFVNFIYRSPFLAYLQNER